MGFSKSECRCRRSWLGERSRFRSNIKIVRSWKTKPPNLGWLFQTASPGGHEGPKQGPSFYVLNLADLEVANAADRNWHFCGNRSDEQAGNVRAGGGCRS